MKNAPQHKQEMENLKDKAIIKTGFRNNSHILLSRSSFATMIFCPILVTSRWLCFNQSTSNQKTFSYFNLSKSTQLFQHHPAVLSSSLLSGSHRSKLSPFPKIPANRPSPRKPSTTDPTVSAPMMGYTESKHIAERTHAYIRQHLSRHSRLRLQSMPDYMQALCVKATSGVWDEQGRINGCLV